MPPKVMPMAIPHDAASPDLDIELEPERDLDLENLYFRRRPSNFRFDLSANSFRVVFGEKTWWRFGTNGMR